MASKYYFKVNLTIINQCFIIFTSVNFVCNCAGYSLLHAIVCPMFIYVWIYHRCFLVTIFWTGAIAVLDFRGIFASKVEGETVAIGRIVILVIEVAV